MIKAFFLLFAVTFLADAAPVSLFDGKSLDGWEIRKGEERWWRVEDGMITGGSLTEAIPFNTFLSSAGRYGDFELKFKIRLIKGDGFMNSGMQVRSERLADNSEMSGYQVDAGPGYWGDLYDESRRNKAIAKAPGVPAKDWEWNEFRVLCEGPRVRTWINGEAAVDYMETDPTIPRDGRIGLQVHGGGKLLVRLKDITINEIAPATGARTPDEERASFTLPPGFTAELVASEAQGVGKPITVAWDRHGRMWTTTALEYPVDANENEAAARELFRRGGKDRVLVFDEPNQPGPQTPRVFADHLAIPLGVLPLKDSVLVQHGSEIRRYRDTDGDGRADGHEVVLEGFGIQDSHLFPHQFERVPGNWIYLAQGAFNASSVRRPDGLPFTNGSISVPFNNCKLARFRNDGSAFEPLTAGPNNIWGIAFARNGETFLQEANDLGYPVAEFAPGTHYPTGFGTKLRDDAPVLPPSTPGQPMGGTGLSGIALADDASTPFAAGHDAASVFYIANPITSKIQIVTANRDAAGHPIYQKGTDFLTSSDPWFRPIATHFGPDGCLYVVDWYNKIISHNEVPRTHPDRDKTRGRIWRIRHQSQPVVPRLDLAALPDDKLVKLLGGANSRVAGQAWQEISDRKATGLIPELKAIVTGTAEPYARRFGALWALEGMQSATPDVLVDLAKSPDPAFRHEAIRIAGESSLPEAEFLTVMTALGEESHFRVRAALANAVRYHSSPTPAVVACAARLGLAPVDGADRSAYDRRFERYLARWAMAVHPDATRGMLAAIDLPVEARLLALRSLPDAEAAPAITPLLPELGRPPIPAELSLLATQMTNPQVMRAYATLLNAPGSREQMLRSMLLLDEEAIFSTQSPLPKQVEKACLDLLREGRTPERLALVARLARKYHSTALSGEVHQWIQLPGLSNAELAEGLLILDKAGDNQSSHFLPYLDHPDEGVRRAALIGFAHADDVGEVIPELAQRWPGMSGAMRSLVVDGLTSSSVGPAAFAKAIANGKFKGFDGTAVEKLISALGTDQADVQEILRTNAGLLRSVLRFSGGEGRMTTNISLKGPFTVEAWVKLPTPIDNEDSLLGRLDGPDFNFWQARFRLYGGPQAGDLIVASRPVAAHQWTHCAITRDVENHLTLYLDGEPDPAAGRDFAGDLTGLNLAESHRGGNTTAEFDEVRIWNVARSGEDIRRDLHTRLSSDSKAPGLSVRISGDSLAGTLEGTARCSPTLDFPRLISAEEAAELDQKFSKFRAWTAQAGDPAKGRESARATCMICHQINGEGTAIGPNLSGAGAMGTESLLRNILTPNAQLESGYYRHDIRFKDSGEVVSGFLVQESPDFITLRQIGSGDRVIRRSAISSHEISRFSLMPEGLLEGFPPQQVADLFAYLQTLR